MPVEDLKAWIQWLLDFIVIMWLITLTVDRIIAPRPPRVRPGGSLGRRLAELEQKDRR